MPVDKIYHLYVVIWNILYICIFSMSIPSSGGRNDVMKLANAVPAAVVTGCAAFPGYPFSACA